MYASFEILRVSRVAQLADNYGVLNIAGRRLDTHHNAFVRLARRLLDVCNLESVLLSHPITLLNGCICT
jgi:hypothetical protein